MNKPDLRWAVKPGEVSGNALGYGTHSSLLMKYAEEFINITDDADIVLHLVPGDKFVPVKGKFNILFTMWEFLEIPNSYIANLNRADAVIVPCKFNRDLFRPLTNKPIYVCQEGIVPENYPFFERGGKQIEKFRFLWSGAPNQRKGYPFIIEAMKVFEKIPNVEIYIKTTSEKLSEQLIRDNLESIPDETIRKERQAAAERIFERIPKMEQYSQAINYLGKNKNVIFDTRKLSLEELRDLYNSAHCFLLPSFGEGWGLTLCEAMATGCPSIATPVTGIADFFDEEVGFGIKTSQKELDIRGDYGIKTLAFIPDTQDLFDKMCLVIHNYDEALRRGRKASERIHKKFTWRRAGQRLKDIIVEIKGKMDANNSRERQTISR